MEEKLKYSSFQTAGLVVLRILIGWHFLYEGMVKVFNPNWTSAGFLKGSQWIFSGMFNSLADSSNLLNIVDFLNEWGLVLIGIGLISGLFTRYASILGGMLLITYYLASPPLVGLKYSMPMEGNYLIVNKTLIEAITLFVLALLPQTSYVYGLDYFIKSLKNNIKGLQDGRK